MKPTLCSRCKKNLAVVFITKIDGGKTVNEGLCLKCAKEMGIKPVDDMIERMGLSEDDLENLNGEMTEAMNGLESLLSQGHDAEDGSEDDEADSQTATFPFLNKLFGAAGQGQDNTPAVPEPEKTESRQRSGDKPNPKNKKHKFLDTYCQNLTQKARDGRLDRIIGREEETERVIQILNRRQKNNPCLIGEPGVARLPSPRALRRRSPTRTFRISSRTRRSISWTSRPSSRAQHSPEKSRTVSFSPPRTGQSRGGCSAGNRHRRNR